MQMETCYADGDMLCTPDIPNVQCQDCFTAACCPGLCRTDMAVRLRLPYPLPLRCPIHTPYHTLLLPCPHLGAAWVLQYDIMGASLLHR